MSEFSVTAAKQPALEDLSSDFAESWACEAAQPKLPLELEERRFVHRVTKKEHTSNLRAVFEAPTRDPNRLEA